MIKIYGTEMNFRPQYQNNEQYKNIIHKYYETTPTKEEVKQDFGAILDTELKKLHFEILI